MDDQRRYRSFFWPVVLIGVGVIWLLANLGLIANSSLAILFRLWPVLLIAIGLDIIFGRRWPLLGALIGLGLIAVVVVLLVAAPNLGLAANIELRTEQFSEPLGDASSAVVVLDLWSSPADISALSESDNLIEVEAVHSGRINFDVSGAEQKMARLSYENIFTNPFDWIETAGRERVDIGLNPEIPLELNIDGGSGSVDLNLSQLQLAELTIESGSGSVEMNLPSTGQVYTVESDSGSGSVSIDIPTGAQADVRIDSGSGSVDVAISEGAQVNLEINSGSGSVGIDVPEGAAVRVEVLDSGSGGVRVPSGLEQVEAGDDDEGIWESAGFESAAQQITVVVEEMGSGSIAVR